MASSEVTCVAFLLPLTGAGRTSFSWSISSKGIREFATNHYDHGTKSRFDFRVPPLKVAAESLQRDSSTSGWFPS
jgi:hypothetical protein